MRVFETGGVVTQLLLTVLAPLSTVRCVFSQVESAREVRVKKMGKNQIPRVPRLYKTLNNEEEEEKKGRLFEEEKIRFTPPPPPALALLMNKRDDGRRRVY